MQRSLRAAEKELGPERSPVARFVAAAVGEADRSEGLATEGVKDRAATLAVAHRGACGPDDHAGDRDSRDGRRDGAFYRPVWNRLGDHG